MHVTYIILVPHDIQESVEGQVEIGPAEAGKGAKDASSEEHSMQMLLCVGEELLHLSGWVFRLLTHLDLSFVSNYL